MAVSTTSALTK